MNRLVNKRLLKNAAILGSAPWTLQTNCVPSNDKAFLTINTSFRVINASFLLHNLIRPLLLFVAFYLTSNKYFNELKSR
ncbi:unnamed protein product [Rotaria socialis]